jgi:U3 small nucleolar ribonucleoprotein component
VQRELYNLESEDDDRDNDVSGSVINYKHFFGSSKRAKNKKSKLSKSVEYEADDDDDNDDDDDEEDSIGGENSDSQEEDEGDSEDEEGMGEAETERETGYSRKKRQLGEQISALEEAAMGAKSWEVLGEVKSSQRPENSLLGIPVDVER